MARGGARPGAGRKPKPKPAAPVVDAAGYKTDAAPPGWPFGKEQPREPEPPEDLSALTPLDYLLGVMRDPEEDKARRMTAAQLAIPYCHPKIGEAKKKDAEKEKAAAAGAGRFGRRAPPQLVASNGQKL